MQLLWNLLNILTELVKNFNLAPGHPQLGSTNTARDKNCGSGPGQKWWIRPGTLVREAGPEEGPGQKWWIRPWQVSRD
jgi:hypothetical protein